MTEPSEISLQAVSRRFGADRGTVEAIDGIEFDLAPGSSVGIMGPSGCGKSTLLGLIAGLDVPTSGRVTVGGIEVSRLRQRDRTRLRRERFGFVFQNDNLLPFLTARENVAFQMALGGHVDGSSRPSDLLDDLGLSAGANKLPDQMSGGQRQRVAVAVAIAQAPSVILADEPTGSLDAANAAAVVDLLLRAREATGATLVVVSHDPDVCQRMSRVITLRNGRVVDDTGPTRLSGGQR